MTEPAPSSWFSPWDLLPLAGALALAVTMPWLMHGLPDPIPTHFDLQGRANGWTPKAVFPWLCFGLPAFIWVTLLLSGRVFIGSDQDPEGRKSAALLPLRGLLPTGALALMGAVALIPRFGQGVLVGMVALFLALLVLGIALAARRLKALAPNDGQAALYVWGMFHVNPEDPRLWVPKRLGLGWTLNFAHGLSWFMLVLLLLPVALVIALFKTR